MGGPLSGIRIVDFTQFMQGPWATQLLGDMGADVIKVEKPGVGDWERVNSYANFFLGGESACFLAMNRNKRSVTLDLKASAGRDLALKLIEKADVVVENSRPGVMDRLGLGYEECRKVNPSIIYVAASGYGPDGPYRHRPGQDLLIQSLTGVPFLTGSADDPPTPAGIPICDQQGGRMVAIAILSALVHKARTGEGQKVDVCLLDAILDAQCQEAVVYLNGGGEPVRCVNGGAHPYVGAPYGIYQTTDSYIAISQTPLAKLAEGLGSPELEAEFRGKSMYECQDAMRERVAAIIRTRSTHEWLEILGKVDIWCGPVRQYHEVFDDPQVIHNKMVQTITHPTAGEIKVTGVPVRFSQTPGAIRLAPPLLGQHTDEVLLESGCQPAEIEALRRDGVI